MRAALLALCAAGLAAALSACQDEEQPPVAEKRPVLAIEVPAPTRRLQTFAGTIEARYRSDLGFRVLGRMTGRSVSVGDTVRAGQVLAQLDPAPFEPAVRGAGADLAAARAKRESARASERRLALLLEKDVTSRSRFEAARQARETADAGVDRAEAARDLAVENLGYTRLVASSDGVVTATGAEPGQVVQPGQMVVALARPDIREAVVDLPEAIAGGLRPDTVFSIALQSDPAVVTSGTLRELAPKADPATRTRRARIALSQPRDFRLGTTVTATLLAPAHPGVVLPRSAVFEREGATRVWIVDPTTGAVSERTVAVRKRSEDTVLVTGDLPPGTRVVVAGASSLESDQIVQIAEVATP